MAERDSTDAPGGDTAPGRVVVGVDGSPASDRAVIAGHGAEDSVAVLRLLDEAGLMPGATIPGFAQEYQSQGR